MQLSSPSAGTLEINETLIKSVNVKFSFGPDCVTVWELPTNKMVITKENFSDCFVSGVRATDIADLKTKIKTIF